MVAADKQSQDKQSLGVDKQSMCVDILVSGHVQAFVDFFYLTHRPDQVLAASGASAGGGADSATPPGGHEEHLNVPSAKLPYIKAQLAEAEVARRQGDTKAVFGSYKHLAALFADEVADHRTAVYFWEKCAEITRLTGDTVSEIEATRALGAAHGALGDVRLAVRYYEKLQRLAASTGGGAPEHQAWARLYESNVLLAEEAASSGDLHGALALQETCLRAAAAAVDSALLRKARYELGQAHERLSDPEHLRQAISHYEPCLRLCEESGDEVGLGAACFALAQAHQRLDDSAASQSYLQRFLEVAQSSGKLSAQAEACCSLGVLCIEQGDYARASEYLERFFELARQMGDKALLDKARTYLGIAKGNALLPAFQRLLVAEDLDALLTWKLRRVPFAE